MALALLTVCSVGAWADSKTIYPTTAMSCRIVEDGSSYKYNSDAQKPATISAEYQESGYLSSGFMMFEKWNLSDVDINRIKQITLTYYSKQGSSAYVWAYGSTLPETTITAADLAAATNTALGAYPKASSAESTIQGNSLNSTTNRTGSSDPYKTVITIKDVKLTTFKNKVADNSVVLIVSTTGSSKTEFYTFNSSDYKAKMEIEYYPVTVTIGETTTNYTEINSTLNSSLTANATVKIYDDVNMTNRIEAKAGVTVDVVPQKAGVIITNTASNSLSFLANTAGGRVNVGSDTNAMIVKYKSNSTNAVVESSYNKGGSDAENTSIVDIKNVTFQDINTSKQGIIFTNNNRGKVYLKDVTFSGCTSTHETTPSIVYCNGNDDAVTLEGNNEFTSCTGVDIYANKRFKIHETNGVTNTTPIKIKTSLALGSVVATKIAETEVAKFDLQDATKGLVKRSGQSRYDLWITEAYTLEVTNAGASTLIIPFAAKLPTGISAYTLTYTSGAATVTATPVETSLTANTPVLINASEGSYKFVNSKNDASVSSATEGSGTHTVGALTGVYAETTPGTGHYVLSVKAGKVGFYKTKETTKVKAYRAYLTAATSDAPELFIDFNMGSTTAIDAVEDNRPVKDGVYYNLNGQRVQNLAKGLYIVNGKKVVIK